MRKINFKETLLILLMLVLSIGMVGCSSKPKGDPQATIEEYYALIDSADYESAYNLLSIKLKEDVDLEKFLTWNNLLVETNENHKYKFTLAEESKDLKLDEYEFPHGIKIKVNKSYKDLYSNKQQTENNDEYVVAENEEWKVYRLKEDFNIDKKIASVYNSLGWISHSGQNSKTDLNRAIEMFSKSIEYNDSNAYYHYSLGVALSDMNRFDEAIKSANKSIELVGDDKESEENKEFLSNSNNLLGTIAGDKGEIDKARQYYNLALELNPDNQYAKSNLTNLE